MAADISGASTTAGAEEKKGIEKKIRSTLENICLESDRLSAREQLHLLEHLRAKFYKKSQECSHQNHTGDTSTDSEIEDHSID